MVDQSFPKGVALAEWLVNVSASTTKGQLFVREAQHTVDAVNTSVAQRWIYADNVKDINGASVSKSVQYFTFNTPIGTPADNQCGRLVYSDIHVASGDTIGAPFPSGCATMNLTPQEKALEFMFFDLTSRVCDDTKPPPPPK